MNGIITSGLVDNAYSYITYRELLDALMVQNKTTGPRQDEEIQQYAKLNIQRMRRIDKTYTPSIAIIGKIVSIDRNITILTITEGWCGDAAQIVPVVEKMIQQNNKISHKLILRDEHPEVMDQFLTNGGRSIPKFIILDSDTLEVLGNWGPRPASASAIMAKRQTNPDNFDQLKEELQLWYAKNNGLEIESEFAECLLNCLKKNIVAAN